MVLELLVQDWRRYGNESLALAVGAMTAEFRGAQAAGTTYQHLLSRIVASLEPQARNVVNLAAVLGQRLNDLEMYELLDTTRGQCVASLSKLAELRILRDGSQGLEFVNELVRAYVYANIPASIRKSLHGSIADRLLAGAGESIVGIGLEIAWHCIRAGRGDQATPHLLRGAREALRRGAPHEAERALASALPNLRGQVRVDGSLLLAEALQEQGCWQESLDRLMDLGGDHGERHDEALVLSALAKLNLNTSSAESIYDRLSELTDIIRTSQRRPHSRPRREGLGHFT